MNSNILNEFLEAGYFIGSPSENKIWCMTSSLKNNSFNERISSPYFYLNNFYLSKLNPICKGNIFFELTYTELLNFLLNEEIQNPDILWNNIDKNYYLSKFNELKNNIADGTIKKGVPYSFLTGNYTLSKKNKIYLLKSLIENNFNNYSYIYGYWDQKSGIMGASPELLFTQNNKNIHTIALAGTVPNNLSMNRSEFLNDPKIKKEHRYVIDGIKLSLSKFGEIHIGETHVLELPKLIHLKTDIKIELNSNDNFDFSKFINVLYPTPAVGTLPKITSSKWLAETELEHDNRGYYAAPFGISFDNNKSLCICAIRGMQWNENSVKICAGGGVIFESDFNAEWEEILSKINAIKHNLGILKI